MHIRTKFEFLLIHLIIILATNSVITEWIDIPQFSDEFKVYRAPFPKSNKYETPIDKPFNIVKNTLSNSTKININRKNERMQVPMIVNVEMTTLAYTVVNTDDNIQKHIKTIKDLAIVSNNSFNDGSINMTNVNVKNKLVMPISQIMLDDCDRKEIDEFPDNTTSTKNYKLIFSKSEQINDRGPLPFLHYLPIELIKRVHATFLQNTLTTIRDKLNFLKTFKNIMLRKLEMKITPVVYSVRRKRGSGWDEHDDHIGFPSLEGALLAISFLTFAVYLIQLVMMLMRNLGNNPANTVLVNRNKRSANHELSEDSIQILEYLDRFSNN